MWDVGTLSLYKPSRRPSTISQSYPGEMVSEFHRAGHGGHPMLPLSSKKFLFKKQLVEYLDGNFSISLGTSYWIPAFAGMMIGYERLLKKADCVIAMLGGDFSERKREALSLVEKGVADVMLIPAWRKMIRYDGGGRKPTVKKTVAVAGRPHVSINLFGRWLDLYENTHLELLLTWEMMVKLGMKSAVVVSSPYHMRRLQLIAGQVSRINTA